jgi:serine/threonine protein kinase
METIDNYTLLKVVGKGSFAKVYLAKDNRSGEQVAIK